MAAALLASLQSEIRKPDVEPWSSPTPPFDSTKPQTLVSPVGIRSLVAVLLQTSRFWCLTCFTFCFWLVTGFAYGTREREDLTRFTTGNSYLVLVDLVVLRQSIFLIFYTCLCSSFIFLF